MGNAIAKLAFVMGVALLAGAALLVVMASEARAQEGDVLERGGPGELPTCESIGHRELPNGFCVPYVYDAPTAADDYSGEGPSVVPDTCETRRNEAGQCVPLINGVLPSSGPGGVYTPEDLKRALAAGNEEVDMGDRLTRGPDEALFDYAVASGQYQGRAGDGRDDVAYAKGSKPKELPRTGGPDLTHLAGVALSGVLLFASGIGAVSMLLRRGQ